MSMFLNLQWYENVLKGSCHFIKCCISKKYKKAWEALNVYFSNKLQFEQKLLLQTRVDNQGNQTEGQVSDTNIHHHQNHHRILHIRISLGSKFQLQQTI